MKLARLGGLGFWVLLTATAAGPALGQARAATAAPGPAAGADEATATLIRAAGLASRHATEIVRSLTDEVGPRLSGSPGDAAAVAWAERTLAAHGFTNVHREAVKVPHWERGDESAAIVAPTRQKLAVTAIGGSVGTPAGGLEAEVVEFPSVDALAAATPATLSGKIAFVNVPTSRERDGSGYGRAGRARWESNALAKKRGAVAVVIRSIGTDHDRFPHTGSAFRDEEPNAIPTAALSNPDADLLHRTVESKGHVRLKLSLGCKWLPEADSANVVADLRGTDKADEIVLLGAHLDSWDLGTGALDDGAGVAIVTEAARLVGAYAKPRRTIRVVLFAAEETGLAGGRGYAKAHEAEAAKHIAAIEADSGTGKVWAARFLGAPQARPLFTDAAKAVLPLGVPTVDSDAHGGSDLGPLKALGVPIVDLPQDMTTYFDIHHTANDTFDKIDPAALAQASATFATMAYSLAMMPSDLGRVPEAKRNEGRH
jgi:carboxypeptidase Q